MAELVLEGTEKREKEGKKAHEKSHAQSKSKQPAEMLEDEDGEVALSEAPAIRIVKEAGAERISQGARKFIMDELKNYSFLVAKEAVAQAEAHAHEKVNGATIAGAASRLSGAGIVTDDEVAALELALAPLQRVLKDAGAERISSSARLTLAKDVQSYATELVKEATRLRSHVGKTLKPIDIVEAQKNMKDKGMLVYGGARAKVIKLDSGAQVVLEPSMVTGEGEDEVKARVEAVMLEGSKLEVAIKGLDGKPPCEFSVTLLRESFGCIESINYGTTKEGVIRITCPQFEGRERLETFTGDAMFTLQLSSQLGNATVDMLVLPRGYSREALAKVFQIARISEFGGVEKELGAIQIDDASKMAILVKMHELAKEYDAVIAYECARRELTRIARSKL